MFLYFNKIDQTVTQSDSHPGEPWVRIPKTLGVVSVPEGDGYISVLVLDDERAEYRFDPRRNMEYFMGFKPQFERLFYKDY